MPGLSLTVLAAVVLIGLLLVLRASTHSLFASDSASPNAAAEQGVYSAINEMAEMRMGSLAADAGYPTLPESGAERDVRLSSDDVKNPEPAVAGMEPIDASSDGAVLIASHSPSPSPESASSATVTVSAYKKPTLSIPVLNYHSVAVDPGNIVVITPEKLEEQMAYLSKNGYEPLTLADFFLILEGRKEPPPKPVLLTFDDGYADNYTHAMPILQKYGFPATMFMSPGTIGDGYYVSWEQAKEMKEAGWDIQPHGMTHPHLPKLGAEAQEQEIADARKLIEEHLGVTADVYCYPYGEYNRDTLKILEKLGFRYAFTIRQGKTDASQPGFELKRIFVNGEASLQSWIRSL